MVMVRSMMGRLGRPFGNIKRSGTVSTASPITYVGGKTATIVSSSGSNTNIVLTDLTGGLAAAPAADDVVVVAYANCSAGDDNLSVVTAGYTEVAEPYANQTDDTNLSVSLKKMGGSPDTSVDVGPTGFAGRPGTVAIQVWRGVDTTTALDVGVSSARQTGDPLVDPPAIGPRTTGAKIIVAGAMSHDATITAFSATGLDNFIQTTRGESPDTSRIGMGSKDWDGVAVFDPVAWTGTATPTSGTMCAVSLALRPAGGAASSVTYNQFLTRFTAATPVDEVGLGTGTLLGNAVCDTANAKVTLDGTGDAVTFSGAGLPAAMRGDWTLECHSTAQGSDTNLVGQGVLDSDDGRFTLYMSSAGARIDFYARLLDATIVSIVGGAIGSVGTNRHFAVVRQGLTYRIYMNGTQIASATNRESLMPSTASLWIGGDPTYGRWVNGTVGRVKISGRAVYPDGTTFTPPAMTAA